MKEGWKYRKLEEICSKGSSNISLNKIEDNDGEYNLYGASGLVKGIDFYHQEQQYIGIVKDGSGVGRVNIYPPKSSLVGTMQYIFPNEGCEIGFLKYLLQGLHLEKYKTGAAIPHIYFKDYCKSIVPFPPLSEQQHIVEELDLLSSIIEKKKAQLNELDNLAQSLFYEMFGDPITNEKGWDSNVLENVVASDCSISYGIVQPGDDVFGGIPVVRPVDLVSNVVKREGLKRVAKNISDSYRRTILKGGEILLCVRGTTGVMSFASDSLAGCNVTRGITPLSFESKLNKEYVFAYLSSKYIKDIIADNTRGATLKQINMKDVRKLPMLIPPLGLQNQFAEKVQAIEHQKELIKHSIKEVETLLNSRMDYYFN